MIGLVHRKPSIFVRLMLSMSALSLVPLIAACLYFYQVLSQNLRLEAESYLNSFATTTNEDLERRLDSIDNTSMMMLSNRELRNLLIDDSQPTSLRSSQIADLIKYQLFFNASWDEHLIEKIYVCRNNFVYFNEPQDFFQTDESLEAVRLLYRKTDDLAVDKYLIPPTPDEPQIVYFRNINDINTTRNIGRMFIQIDPARLHLNSSLIRYPQAMIMTINDTGTIFSHTDSSQVGQLADPALFQLRDVRGLAELELQGEPYLVESNHLASYGLYSFVAVPKAEVFAGLYKARQLAVELLITILVACLVLSGLIARRITRDTRAVISSMELIRQGHFDERMVPQHVQEYDELAGVFNRMAKEIDHLIHEVYQKQLLLREAELSALHAQVNPHFLFNVLETISWQARLNDDPTVDAMIASLAQLLRADISWSGRELTSIADELRYIQFYLDLQKVRFADRLSIRITLADESLRSWLIPRLSLIPLVENAFIHGLECKKGPGQLQISIWDEGELLYCQVSDDGTGFDPGSIPLNFSDPVPNTLHQIDRQGIGILNTHYRIRLLFGLNYGVRLQSAPGLGTKVTLVMPRTTSKIDPGSSGS